jgi:hypothetical protein
MRRSMEGRGADGTVMSDKVEMISMASNKGNLTGGSLGPKGAKVPLKGGSMGVGNAGGGLLAGKLGKDGGGAFKKTYLRENSPGKGRTTREQIGNDSMSTAGPKKLFGE